MRPKSHDVGKFQVDLANLVFTNSLHSNYMVIEDCGQSNIRFIIVTSSEKICILIKLTAPANSNSIKLIALKMLSWEAQWDSGTATLCPLQAICNQRDFVCLFDSHF